MATNATSIDILSWFPGDWSSGIIFFILGLLGAAAVVYLYVGQLLPSVNSTVRMRKLEVDIEADESESDELLKKWQVIMQKIQSLLETKSVVSREFVNSKITFYQTTIDKLNDRIKNLGEEITNQQKDYDLQRRTLERMSIAFYIPLGGGFATLLAADFIQAIAIGAGWTAFTSILGIREQKNEEKFEKERESNEQKEKNKRLKEVIDEAVSNTEKDKENLDKLQEENKELKDMVFSQAKMLKESLSGQENTSSKGRRRV